MYDHVLWSEGDTGYGGSERGKEQTRETLGAENELAGKITLRVRLKLLPVCSEPTLWLHGFRRVLGIARL
jgi:hypothetical protein